MKKIINSMALLTLLLLAACKKDVYQIYTNGDKAQFGPEYSRFYRSGSEFEDTSKSFTFVYEADDIIEDTVFFDIYAIGGISNKDRSYTLKQMMVPGMNNAVPDKDYIGFDKPVTINNFVIKADSIHAAVPVILLRDAALKDTSVVLKFQIVANRDFQLGDSAFLWRKVTFSDALIRPAAWDAAMSKYYFGDYSKVKHQFMIDSTGQKWDQNFILELRSIFETARLFYWTDVIKIKLINYNNAHTGNPLKDENEQLVIFP